MSVGGAAVGLIFLLPLGWIVLNFMFFDVSDPPSQTQRFGRDLVCTVTEWGFGGGGGYIVHLHRVWADDPEVWREVARVTVDQAAPTAQCDESCESLLATYKEHA